MSDATTSVSAGHVDALDAALLERALLLREKDRARWKMAKRMLRSLAILAVPACCVVAVVVPEMSGPSFGCRAMRFEGKRNLKALYVAEESYRAEYDRYTLDVAALGFAPRDDRMRYRYLALTALDDKTFTAFAVGVVGPVSGDIWRIDEQNDMVDVRNACVR